MVPAALNVRGYMYTFTVFDALACAKDGVDDATIAIMMNMLVFLEKYAN